MSDARSLLSDRAAELRLAFDRSFAEARPPDPSPSENLLAIRLGSEPYALRLSEIAGLFVGQKITRLPSRIPALLGIAGFRGTILPVYDLHVLLGHPPAETMRWLVTDAGASVAFAFAAMDGHIRVSRDAIVASERSGNSRAHVREFARTPELVRAIVHLPSVFDAIRDQVSENTKKEER